MPPFAPLPGGMTIVEANVTTVTVSFTLNTSGVNNFDYDAFVQVAEAVFGCYWPTCTLSVTLLGDGSRRRLQMETAANLRVTMESASSLQGAALEATANGVIAQMTDELTATFGLGFASTASMTLVTDVKPAVVPAPTAAPTSSTPVPTAPCCLSLQGGIQSMAARRHLKKGRSDKRFQKKSLRLLFGQRAMCDPSPLCGMPA